MGQLSAAFRVEQRVLRDLLDLYEDKNNRKEQLRAELRFHLRALQQHAYYSRQAFPVRELVQTVFDCHNIADNMSTIVGTLGVAYSIVDLAV